MQTFANSFINKPIKLRINNCLNQPGLLKKKCVLDMPKYKLKVFPSKNYPSLYIQILTKYLLLVGLSII